MLKIPVAAAQDDILLLACYELGHQPLSLAWPLAALDGAGLAARAVDLAVSPFPTEAAGHARFVGIAVPMHTALRLGVEAARQVRQINPTAHICFYGLYAHLNAPYLLETVADSVIAGEVEGTLVELARRVLQDGLSAANMPDGITTRDRAAQPVLQRTTLPIPLRAGLPGLDRYARIDYGDRMELAGYVEASRGCLHTCRHCPVVPIYRGRFFVVAHETVMTDIRQQVALGARHITFGDPDFLNGPGHAMRIVRDLHAEFPDLTFDFTTKVEHILQHHRLFRELRALGAAFVVSAFEGVNDDILKRLRKGHTRADMDEALVVLRDAGLPVQPTWMPFTPWTTPDDYVELLAWISDRGLIGHVPAVQLSIRMLVPPGSILLEDADSADWVGPLDAANFTYEWRHPNPAMDALQRRVAAISEQGGEPAAVFARIEAAARAIATPSAAAAAPMMPQLILPPPPRLTEDWFC